MFQLFYLNWSVHDDLWMPRKRKSKYDPLNWENELRKNESSEMVEKGHFSNHVKSVKFTT